METPATTEYPQPRIEQAERPQTVQYVLNPIKHLIRRLELNKVEPVSLGASTHDCPGYVLS